MPNFSSFSMRTHRQYLLAIGLFLVFTIPAVAQKSKLNEGYSAFASGKYDDAITALNEGLMHTEKLKPKDIAKGYMTLGNAYLNNFTLIGTNIGGLGPKIAAKYPNILLDAAAAYTKAAENDVDKAQEPELKKQHIPLANDLYTQGFNYYHDSNYTKAIVYLNEAEKFFKMEPPAYYGLYTLRGYTEMAQKDSAHMAADYEQAISLYYTGLTQKEDLTIPSIFRILTDYYQKKGDLAKALATIQLARQKMPENKELRDTELQLYITQPSLLDQALVKFQGEAERYPGDEVIQLQYATLLEKKDEEKAVDVYKKVLQMNPNRSEANFNLGVIYYNRGAAYSKPLQNANTKADQDKYTKLITDQFNIALPYLEKAYQLEPTNFGVVDALFRVYSLLNNEEKANFYLAKKKELGG